MYCNKIFIILELLQGRSLKSLIRSSSSNSFDDEKCKLILKPILHALEYIHSKHISHRDLKMENIIIEGNGTPKLIDFGFGAIEINKQKLKAFCGTPSYMPPEIVNKNEYEGPIADMWSFGVLLFLTLSGNFPFRGFSEKDLFFRISRGAIQFPLKIGPKSKVVIRRLLEVNPCLRATAKEVFLIRL